MTKHIFVCAGCLTSYCTTTTDDEIESEYKDNYGESAICSDEELASICDACYAILIDNGTLPRHDRLAQLSRDT